MFSKSVPVLSTPNLAQAATTAASPFLPSVVRARSSNVSILVPGFTLTPEGVTVIPPVFVNAANIAAACSIPPSGFAGLGSGLPRIVSACPFKIPFWRGMLGRLPDTAPLNSVKILGKIVLTSAAVPPVTPIAAITSLKASLVFTVLAQPSRGPPAYTTPRAASHSGPVRAAAAAAAAAASLRACSRAKWMSIAIPTITPIAAPATAAVATTPPIVIVAPVAAAAGAAAPAAAPAEGLSRGITPFSTVCLANSDATT